MVYLYQCQLKGKKIPVVNIIKETRWLKKYVHIYNLSVAQDMIIKYNFWIWKLQYYFRKGLKETYLQTPQTHTQLKYQDDQSKWLQIFPYETGYTE